MSSTKAVLKALDNTLAIRVLEQVPTPVMAVDRDLKIVFMNEAGRSLLGMPLDEIRKHRCADLLNSLHCNTPDCRMRRAIETGERGTARNELSIGGKLVKIEYTAAPLRDDDGNIIGGVEYVLDITDQETRNADYSGQIEAIGKSMAVISFELDGTILDANDNFLRLMGYTLAEVQGKHHSMFVEPAQRGSAEYSQFWAALNRGEFQSAQFKRLGKAGREVWIQASYNPILDLNGKPFKVVKYAADITERVRSEEKIREQHRTIQEISTPAISLWEGIIILPVVGVVDSMRAQQMMNTMLSKIRETSARIIILDIQGVVAVDTAVAAHLIKITKATKLMGCRCLISGISPAVAETLVQLGIDLGDVATNATLRDSLGDAFAMLSFEVRRLK